MIQLEGMSCTIKKKEYLNKTYSRVRIGNYFIVNNGPTGAATFFQRWKKVAAPILWPIPEAAVTVFSTPDDGRCDARNM